LRRGRIQFASVVHNAPPPPGRRHGDDLFLIRAWSADSIARDPLEFCRRLRSFLTSLGSGLSVCCLNTAQGTALDLFGTVDLLGMSTVCSPAHFAYGLISTRSRKALISDENVFGTLCEKA
jgi:hypothetical protein